MSAGTGDLHAALTNLALELEADIGYATVREDHIRRTARANEARRILSLLPVQDPGIS